MTRPVIVGNRALIAAMQRALAPYVEDAMTEMPETQSFTLANLSGPDAYWLGAYVASRKLRGELDFDWVVETARALGLAREAGDIAAWCRQHLRAEGA